MANLFLEALDEYRRRDQPAPAPQPSAPLPTEYSIERVPQGTLRDADTLVRPTGEAFRGHGIDAPELKDRKTGELIPAGQEAYARSATLFRQNPDTTPVRYGNDYYGRTVADEVTPDGRSVYGELVRSGDARQVNYNRAPTLPHNAEANARFDETNPPSDAAKALAAFRGGPVSRADATPVRLDPKYRTSGEELATAWQRGGESAKSGAYGMLSAVGAALAGTVEGKDPREIKDESKLSLRDRITNWMQRTGEAGYMEHEAKSRELKAPGTFQDVLDRKLDLWSWGLSALGEAAPSTLAMAASAAATGGIGALAGRAAAGGALGAALKQSAAKAAEAATTTAIRRKLIEGGVAPLMAQSVARSVAVDPVKHAMRTYGARAAFAGAWGGSATLEGGHIYEETKQTLGQQNTDPWQSIGAGLAAGFLDTAAVAYLAAPFAKAFSTPAAQAALAPVAGKTMAEKLGGLVTAVAGGALKGVPVEGLTEAAQEMIAVASLESQRQSDVPLVDRLMAPEYLHRYMEAGAAGALFGGVFSGVGGGFSHATLRTQPRGDTTDAGPGPDSGSSTATNTGPQPSPSPQTGEPTIAGASPSVAGSGSPSASGPSASPDITGVEQDLGGLSHPDSPKASSTGVSNTAPPAGPVGRVLNEVGAPIAPPEERGYDDERKAIIRRQMELLAEQERQGAAAPEELPPDVKPPIDPNRVFDALDEAISIANAFAGGKTTKMGLPVRVYTEEQAQEIGHALGIVPRWDETDIEPGWVLDAPAQEIDAPGTLLARLQQERKQRIAEAKARRRQARGHSSNSASPETSPETLSETPPETPASLSADDPEAVMARVREVMDFAASGYAVDEYITDPHFAEGTSQSWESLLAGTMRGLGLSDEEARKVLQYYKDLKDGVTTPGAPSELSPGAPSELPPGAPSELTPSASSADGAEPNAQAPPGTAGSPPPSPSGTPRPKNRRSSAPTTRPPSPAPVVSKESSRASEPPLESAALLPDGKVWLRFKDSTKDETVSREEFERRMGLDRIDWENMSTAEFDELVADAVAEHDGRTFGRPSFDDRRIPRLDGLAGIPNVSPELVAVTAPNIAPQRTRVPDMSPLEPETPVVENSNSAVREGMKVARQLTALWRGLLGLPDTDTIAVTREQALGLAAPADVRAHYEATLGVARGMAQHFIRREWDGAGEKVREQIQEAYALHKKEVDFDTFLGEEVSRVLLHDAELRRIYADANLPAAYRWLRKIGQALHKLVGAFAKRFGHEVKEAAPAVAEWVRHAVDARRTEFAERQGFSAETTRLLKEATNHLLTDRNIDAALDSLEQRLAEEQTGSFYRNWLTALRAAQRAATAGAVADEFAPVKVRERLSAALREGLAKIDPWYAPDEFGSRAERRAWLRQRGYDYVRALPALERASPEAAEAARNVLNLVLQAEDALAVAGSLSRASDLLTPEGRATSPVRGTTMREAASASEVVKSTDRALAVDAKRQKPPEGYVPPRGAKAALSAMWRALGLAAEDVPPLLPEREDMDSAVLGIHVAPTDDPVAQTRAALADYLVARRALEGLPAAYRDALVAAWRERGDGEFANWLANETDKVLASDAALFHVQYRLLPTDAHGAERGATLQIERRTYNELLGRALASTERPDPAVRDALRYRVAARYGIGVLADADRLLGGTGTDRNAWFLLSQGYARTKDGSPMFDAKRRASVQRILADAHWLLESTPELSDESTKTKAEFLRKNVSALADLEPAFAELAPGQDAALALVDWYTAWDRRIHRQEEEDDYSPGEAVADDGRSERDDEEDWQERALLDGASMADQEEMYQETKDAAEQKTALVNRLALMSLYTPPKTIKRKDGKDYTRYASLVRGFRVIAPDTAEGSPLNSAEATDFDIADALIDAPFEADPDNGTFVKLPLPLQHALLQRVQALSRIGITASEYRIKVHKTPAGRSVKYVQESMTLGDRATLHGGRLKDGSPVSDRLATDHVREMLEEAARYTEKSMAVSSRRGKNPGDNYGAVMFDVRAAVDHPLIARMVEAIYRDSNIAAKIETIRAGWTTGDRAALLKEIDALLPAASKALDDLDSRIAEMRRRKDNAFQLLLAAAMGFDQDVFYGGGGKDSSGKSVFDNYKVPGIPAHQRPTAQRVKVEIDPEFAREIGIDPAIRLTEDDRPLLSAFLRMYVTNFDANSGTFKTGHAREVTGDALVGLGMRSLNGLDAAPNVAFSRIDSLYRGFDLASQLPSPWVPRDPFWQSWQGLDDPKLIGDPHLNLVVFFDKKKPLSEQLTLASELAGRKPQQMIQGAVMGPDELVESSFDEKSLAELDEDVQVVAAQIDEMRRRFLLDPGNNEQPGVLSRQVVSEDGLLVWTYADAMPPEVLARAMDGGRAAALDLYNRQLRDHDEGKKVWVEKTDKNGAVTKVAVRVPKPKMPELGPGMRWLRRFRNGTDAKKPPTVKFEGKTYTARPFIGLDELQRLAGARSGIRKRISDLRDILKQSYLTENRGLSGSELNYSQNIEEELDRIDAWLDSLGLGDNAARMNPEAALFNPDLNSPKVQWDADLKAYKYQGYTNAELKGEAPGQDTVEKQRASRASSTPTTVKPLPARPSTVAGVLNGFAADAARTMGLDPKGFKLTLIDANALLADKERTAEEAFRDAMAAIGHAELAEQAWRQAADEPVFVLFNDGVPHIVAFDADLTSGAKLSEAFLRRAVAHELGHVYFDRHLKAELARRGARTRLVNQLKGVFPGKTIETDLEIEEAVAEALADSIVGKAPAKQTVLGKIVDAVKSAWARFFGEKREDLSFMAAHNEKRVHEKGAQGDGIRYYSGRKLLEDTKAAGAGTWATMKDLYSTVVRTAHSWLRSQLDAKGAPIDAFNVMADILRWTPGVAPQTRSFGGQLFDFTSTDGDYRISYEQATTRHFARFGHRVETMFNSWNPANEKASIWDAKKRAEIAETQRQRQVQAVQDYVNGVKTKHSVELGQLFDALGDYFGPVLKRHDPTKTLPRIFDQTALRERKDDFLALLERSGVEAEEAEQIWSRLAKEAGSDYRNDANVFFAPHFQRARMGDALDAISDRDLLPFLLIDSQPQAALWQYVHQAVKRTEFERRFGGWVYFDKAVDFSPEANVKPRLLSPADEEKMREARPIDAGPGKPPKYGLPNGKSVIWDHTAKWRMLRAEAAAQGATPGQLNHFLKITEAELGRLGADFSPRLRTLQSALVAGMNWAVLPLSLTSQVTDLALPLLRSNGDFASAWKGMKTAIRELRKNGDLYAAAKANGILAGNLRGYFASSYLDAPYMDSWAMKWNERLFKLNGMEKATEFVRLYAFATGAEWIKALAAKNTTEADAQLAQLGLDRADVLAWQAQQEKLDTGEGAPDGASERVQQALDTFVEQSMFRPSASQRPTWASHPAAMLVWYLKSYIWAYADTILSRTWREFQRMDGYGQKALVLAMPALFMLPLAMLGLALRDELRDDLDGIVPWRMPKREREETATDEIARLIGRTGLLGPMQTLIDAGRASEYGSPYYLALIGPFATMTDQALKRIGSAGEGKVTKSVAESLMQLAPVLGSLPQERRALANWTF